MAQCRQHQEKSTTDGGTCCTRKRVHAGLCDVSTSGTQQAGRGLRARGWTVVCGTAAGVQVDEVERVVA